MRAIRITGILALGGAAFSVVAANGVASLDGKSEMAAVAGVARCDGGSAKGYFSASPFAGSNPMRQIVGTIENQLGAGTSIDGAIIEFRGKTDVSEQRVVFSSVTVGATKADGLALRRTAHGIVADASFPKIAQGAKVEFIINGVYVQGPVADFDYFITPLVFQMPAGTPGRAVAFGNYELTVAATHVERSTVNQATDRLFATVKNGDPKHKIVELTGALRSPEGKVAKIQSVTAQTTGDTPSLVPGAEAKLEAANGFRLVGFDALAPGGAIGIVIVLTDGAMLDQPLELQLSGKFE